MAKISDHIVGKDYGKRQVVFEPQDKDKVFILKTGKLEIYELTPDGKKIIVDVLTPGNIFGDLGIEETSENFVEASTNSFVCVMKKKDFFGTVAQNPLVSYQLIRELFAKSVEANKQVAALASDNLVIKFRNLLVRLGKRYGVVHNDTVVIQSKFTHEKLAEMIGISRPTMTEFLNKLEKQGVITRQGKIISYDPQKLANL